MFADVDTSHPISQLVHQVNKLLPDPGLKHLKKIRRTEDGECHVLLGRWEHVQQNLEEIQCLPIGRMRDCHVPACQPFTRQQFEECKLLWPTSFHEDKYIQQCIDGTRFNSQQLARIRGMVKCLNLKRKENRSHVCLIVNGEQVLASESDCSDHHPLHHATLLAVGAVARTQLSNGPSEAYLCTNYEAFLSREICLMCAMALLHSRIRRVFFVHDATEGSCPPDGPFTRMKLHTNEKLNHRFEVWSVRNGAAES